LGSSSFTFSSVTTFNKMALSNITASEVANNDLAYLYDTSDFAAKKITVSELKNVFGSSGPNITTSTSEPTSSDGAVGDIWLVYEA